MIYSVCKCDTHPSARNLIREEKERFGEDLKATIMKLLRNLLRSA